MLRLIVADSVVHAMHLIHTKKWNPRDCPVVTDHSALISFPALPDEIIFYGPCLRIPFHKMWKDCEVRMRKTECKKIRIMDI